VEMIERPQLRSYLKEEVVFYTQEDQEEVDFDSYEL
jgi:hypothetical protein